MYGCESWTIKKAECRRIDAFELWCWRRLLRVPWTARRSNQSILKKISPEYSLERLMLKLQYFDHLMWRTDSLENTLMLGKIEGGRRRGRWWNEGEEGEMVGCHYQSDKHEFEQAPGVGDRQGSLVCCSPWGHKELDRTEWLNWTVEPPKIIFLVKRTQLWRQIPMLRIYGNPLQCSCLENPRDWGAWWAAVSGVAELHMTEAA